MAQYSEHIVTFIDILGFRELVATKAPDEILAIVNQVREAVSDDDNDPLQLKSIAFSDSVLRARPIDAESGLFYELLDLLHAQANLVAQGVLIRGAVTFGNLLMEGNDAFGPGFVEAYELESKFAIFPRIVVSPRRLESFASGSLAIARHHDIKEESRSVKSILARGEDGLWFIDYLRAFRSECDEPEEYCDFLDRHRNVVLHLIQNLKKDPGLSALALKINWIAHYHDSVVRGLSVEALHELGVERDELLLPEDALVTLFDFRKIRRK